MTSRDQVVLYATAESLRSNTPQLRYHIYI